MRLEPYTPLIITVQWMWGNSICYYSAACQRHQISGYKTIYKVQLMTRDSKSPEVEKICANCIRNKARGTSL